MPGASISSIFLATAFVVILSAIPAPCGECNEYFTLDEKKVAVPPRWCGLKVDSLDIADASLLVPLADELTFEDFHIYVRPEVKAAFTKMAEAAFKDSIRLIADSGYRSSAFQKTVIRRRIKAGEKLSDILAMVAPPGYSEHETGRALDLIPSDAGFASHDAYRWLLKNAARFGFRESYPESAAEGIAWEPWHWVFAVQDR